MEQKYLKIISHSIMFKGIDPTNILHVLECLDYKITDFRKNEYIARIHSPIKGVFIVLEGETAIVSEKLNGDRIVLNLFNVGDVCGEALAFCGSSKWPMSFQALSDSKMIIIHPEKILNMCNKACKYHNTILLNIIRVVAKKACDLNRKVDYLMLKTINGKLSKYILEHKEEADSQVFVLPLNREKLADYLNISRPSMSRELSRMRENGILDYKRNSIQVLDEEKLRSYLEQ
jgi:CRP-like cAMP-binding protein